MSARTGISLTVSSKKPKAQLESGLISDQKINSGEQLRSDGSPSRGIARSQSRRHSTNLPRSIVFGCGLAWSQATSSGNRSHSSTRSLGGFGHWRPTLAGAGVEGFRAAGTVAVKEAVKAEHWRRRAVEQLLFKMTGTV